MNLQKLFEAQKILDDRIVKERGLEGQDLLPNKILALQIELGELANEWRGFKHWSNDQTPRTKGYVEDFTTGEGQEFNPMLEEYVDCLHFILSIGLETKTAVADYRRSLFGKFGKAEVVWDSNSIIREFQSVFELTTKTGTSYNTLVLVFLDLGFMLGFTQEQIEQAYFDKNKVNHKRQSTGY